MFIPLVAALLVQGSLVDIMAADASLTECIKLATDDALLKDIKPTAFPSHLTKICGPTRDKWMKARDAADGENADPEDTFYKAKARFESAAAAYSKRYSTR